MELKHEMREAYSKMATSKNVAYMKVAGGIMLAMFDHIADTNPAMAKEYYERFDGAMEYNNFLTEREAMEVVGKLMNQDGSMGPAWKPETVWKALDSWGYEHEHKPYFNKWALYATMCMIYSDSKKTISDITKDETEIAHWCYKFSCDKLKDKDREHFVRWYFGLQ